MYSGCGMKDKILEHCTAQTKFLRIKIYLGWERKILKKYGMVRGRGSSSYEGIINRYKSCTRGLGGSPSAACKGYESRLTDGKDKKEKTS